MMHSTGSPPDRPPDRPHRQVAMSGMSNATNNALASVAAKTPGLPAELRRQAARAFCSGYYGTSRPNAIEATLEGHEISITASVRDSVGHEIRMLTAHIKSLPVPDQVALLDELRQEVLVGAGKRDAPMTEYVTCDSCCRDCTKNYYTTVVSQSTDESGATKQLDACALCFSRVGSVVVASSSEKAAVVQYVDSQPVRRLLTKADPNFDVLRKQMFKDSRNDPRNDTRGVQKVASSIQERHRDEQGNSAPYTRDLVESSRKRRGWRCVDGKWQPGPDGVVDQAEPGPSPLKTGRPKKVQKQVVSNTTAVATCDDPAAIANGATDGGETANPWRAREKELQAGEGGEVARARRSCRPERVARWRSDKTRVVGHPLPAWAGAGVVG